MYKIRLNLNKNSFVKNEFASNLNNFLYLKCHIILVALNFLFSIYLLIQNNKNNSLIKELLKQNSDNKKQNSIFNKDISDIKNYKQKIDIDMVGLKYPEIYFEKFKYDSFNGKLISSFCNFLTQLENKLIYLEKEINVTKLNAFYTARTLYLKKRKVHYDDSKIKKFHDIISWLVIHKSTQLKGIASDKYLGCKYVEMKIGKNLCSQRIGVYNSIEEVNFEKLLKIKNVVLKISNGCHDNIYITENNTINDIDNLKKELEFHFNRDYSFIVPEFFHSFSKKRIILEKLFIPITDLYEFKFLVFNHEIKLCILLYFLKNEIVHAYLDANFNVIKSEKPFIFSKDIFKTDKLHELKSLAIKLSEDFPNFIRVDLYLFKNEIYLSELTFDSHSGIPALTDIKYFNDGLKNWKRYDY